MDFYVRLIIFLQQKYNIAILYYTFFCISNIHQTSHQFYTIEDRDNCHEKASDMSLYLKQNFQN